MGDFPEPKERIRQWCQQKSQCDENAFVIALRNLSFDDDSIKLILEEIDEICHECWDAAAGCQCWNDE